MNAVRVSVLRRFAHGLAFSLFGRVTLVLGTHLMLGFYRQLLRHVAAQLFAQFFRIVRGNLAIVAPA
jgi:hypothetical protein